MLFAKLASRTEQLNFDKTSCFGREHLVRAI